MQNNGAEVYVRFSTESNSRILHPVTVHQQQDGLITLECTADLQHDLQENESLFLYFEEKREFMQQPAVFKQWVNPTTLVSDSEQSTDDQSSSNVAVQTETQTETDVLYFAIQTVGEPVSAESRQCYRVSTVLSNYTSQVNNKTCALLDVSITGFSVISSEDLKIGDNLDVTLNWQNKDFSGTATVQSIKPLTDGATRYGIYCTDDKRSSGDIIKGLQQISMGVQREQLKRQSGT